jgi:hypothetical protein
LKLSNVKTDADFERYEAGKIAQTDEELRAQMGIGPRAFTLPDPSQEEMGEDSFYAYKKWIVDHDV